ncbi:hypothetical protein ABES58_11810 [Paenibacillus lautus]|uniref:hypothetical protein n=1 Tax=Paenibacillus lautus TaxID=1401 RepID=UPI003D29D417
MVNEINRIVGKVNDTLGVSMTPPEPKKNTLNVASAVNLVVGAGFIVAGVILMNIWCAVIGGLGIISGIIQSHKVKATK